MSRNVPASLLTSLPKNSPAREFPFLAYLMGSWLHQDYSDAGDTIGEILCNYEQTLSDSEKRETLVDIERFLAQHEGSEQTVSDAFVAVFNPEVIVEGWDGLTTRQWLLMVADHIRHSAGE